MLLQLDAYNLAGLVLLVAVVLIFLRFTQRSTKATSERIRGMRKPLEHTTLPPAHNLDAPPGVAEWEVHMHELARDLSGQLDTKIAILSQLVRDADQRIARLEGLDTDVIADPAIEVPKSTPPAPPLAANAERTRQIYNLADAGYTSEAIATRLGNPRGDVELILSLRGAR